MEIKVFISATRRDLEPDIVPAAKRAIDEEDVEPVEMGSWSTDYANPVDVCKGKLEDSTHYIGLFAHWRGTGLDDLDDGNVDDRHLDKSITQYEYWLAQNEFKLQSAIFVPQAGTPFDTELIKRAEDQSEEQEQAQQAFLETVKGGGTIMPFPDPVWVYQKACQRIQAWGVKGGIRGAGRGKKKKAVDLSILGRRPQEKQFRPLLSELKDPGAWLPAAILIHGPSGCGHKYLAARLSGLLEKEVGKTHSPVEITVGAGWQDDSVETLVESVASFFTDETDGQPTIASIASGMAAELEQVPVTIIIQRVQRLSGGLSSFISELWKDLRKELPDDTPNPLTVIVTDESANDVGDQLITPATEFDAEDSDRDLPIALPRLGDFNCADLTKWYRQHGRDEDQAEAEAIAILDETGGNAATILVQLASGS